jgi:molybdenum cofactor cytidylyltransferase
VARRARLCYTIPMSIAGLLLAAGSARRMGQNKILLTLGGESLLRRSARAALAAGLDPVIVVLGHEAPRAAAEIEGLPCRAVVNAGHAGGMNTSLSAGVEAVPPEATALVVLLADMPLVTPRMIRSVVDLHRETGAPLVTCRYGETAAPPTLYARSFFDALCGGEGEGRGRSVVRQNLHRALFVEWPAAALADVDVAEDLETVRARLGAGGGP